MTPMEHALVQGRLNKGCYRDWGRECETQGLSVGKLKVAYLEASRTIFAEVPAGLFLG